MLSPRSWSAASRRAWWLLILATLQVAATTPRADAPATGVPQDVRALVHVRTLVIDSLGTRTVDADSARVPLGGKGLLLKRVPYAGPPLSYRLLVHAGIPVGGGLPVTLSAEIWSGDISDVPSRDEISRREEATVLSSESSFLLEIDHDARTDRRVLLSMTARALDASEPVDVPATAPIGRPLQFLIELTRESEGVAGLPDRHMLQTVVGRPATYSSGITPLGAEPGSASRFIGVSLTLTGERASGDLVTVKVEMSGAEFIDKSRSRIAPIHLVELRTTESGSTFELGVKVPQDPAPQADPVPDPAPVAYRLLVTPTLGS